ncbi:hypothetical protein ACJMK2_042260 [Sinanodonta woodiana]|uniref:Uncharacterized protein n=1 Tax=Sinanodonta woodiana TaxID=1069815 RepID=A0ABD3W6U2_SINWO
MIYTMVRLTGIDLPSKPVSSAVTDRSTNVTDMPHMTTLFDTIGLNTQMVFTAALYTFAAVFASVLLAMFLLICIYFYRTRPPKIPEILPTDELWPDSDLVQNIHDLYFANQSPYFVNPVYYDERTDSHKKQNNVDGETVCRNHLSTLTVSNNCSSGKGNSSRPLAGSPKRNELYSDNVCVLSYRKTDCKINDLYGDGSDV